MPTANTIVISRADKFGLAQLHQLRGRVGRGTAPGLCLLVTEAMAGTPARERLDAQWPAVEDVLLARRTRRTVAA